MDARLMESSWIPVLISCAPATVQWPDGSSLAISGTENLNFLVVYNPPQENYVCVEPVSHMTGLLSIARPAGV